MGEEGKEEFKLQTSWRMIDSSGGREDGGGVVETATKNLKKLILVLYTAIDPISILPPVQSAHKVAPGRPKKERKKEKLESRSS